MQNASKSVSFGIELICYLGNFFTYIYEKEKFWKKTCFDLLLCIVHTKIHLNPLHEEPFTQLNSLNKVIIPSPLGDDGIF